MRVALSQRNNDVFDHLLRLVFFACVQVDYAESVELSLQQLQQQNTSNDDWDVLRGIADELGVSDGTNKSAARRQFLDTFGVKQVSHAILNAPNCAVSLFVQLLVWCMCVGAVFMCISETLHVCMYTAIQRVVCICARCCSMQVEVHKALLRIYTLLVTHSILIALLVTVLMVIAGAER
jgi:hypothetical protein